MELCSVELKEGINLTVTCQLERPQFMLNGKEMRTFQIRAEKVEL